MTGKRFGIVKTKSYELYVPTDEQKIYNFSGMENELDCMRIVNALNELNDENKELKSHINDTQIAVEIETEKCMNRVFDLIDKYIDEIVESKDRLSLDSYNSSMITLEGLKEELKGGNVE